MPDWIGRLVSIAAIAAAGALLTGYVAGAEFAALFLFVFLVASVAIGLRARARLAKWLADPSIDEMPDDESRPGPTPLLGGERENREKGRPRRDDIEKARREEIARTRHVHHTVDGARRNLDGFRAAHDDAALFRARQNGDSTVLADCLHGPVEILRLVERLDFGLVGKDDVDA